MIFDSETMELARTVAGAVANGGLPKEGVPIRSRVVSCCTVWHFANDYSPTYPRAA